MIATYRIGPDTGVPLVIAHGLYGSARNWGTLAKRLAETRPVITVDMRNHAQSPWFESHSYEDMADDLTQVIDQTGQSDLLGHSMGGKAAMLAALCGAKVRKLIVADIAPVTYTHTQIHNIRAMQLVDLSIVNSRSDADEQLKPLVPDRANRAFFLQSLDVENRRWRLNLDVLAAEMPKIIGFPKVSGTFKGPSLFLAGADSSYVQPQHRARIQSLFPAARFAKIPGAGHWLHAEKPREFAAAVEVFLGD